MTDQRGDELEQAFGFLRQWLNEDRIHYGKMVTNEELHHWLDEAIDTYCRAQVERARREVLKVQT